ncbi:hypothetical protein HK096_011082 [Nowakowskiella sp. JEL0078]|nr:hypothetical protein HK096_011082 [Nowakowskiella sp. JEL0078]
MAESTSLSKFFAEQGLKIRLRKEPKTGKIRSFKNFVEGDSDEEETEHKRLKSTEEVEEVVQILPSISRAQAVEEESGRKAFNPSYIRSPVWNHQRQIHSPPPYYPHQYGHHTPQIHPNYTNHMDNSLERIPPSQGNDRYYPYQYPQPSYGAPQTYPNQPHHHGYPPMPYQQYEPGYATTQYMYPPAPPRFDRRYPNYSHQNDYVREVTPAPGNVENQVSVSHSQHEESHLQRNSHADTLQRSEETNFTSTTSHTNGGYHNYQPIYQFSGQIGERGNDVGHHTAQPGYYPNYPESGPAFDPRNGTSSAHLNQPHVPPSPYYQGLPPPRPPRAPTFHYEYQRSRYRPEQIGSGYNSSAF